HETAYGNNLKKIQHANEKLIELRDKIQKYDAELKMSSAEAEIAKLSETFDVNLTTDFGEIESVIQQKIDQNRGKVRVSADLSERGIAEIKAEERMQGQLAEQALQNFEVELGLRSPETTPVAQALKISAPPRPTSPLRNKPAKRESTHGERTAETGVLRGGSARGARPRRPGALALRRDRARQ